MAGITLSLAQARTLYEDHFKEDMPEKMKYLDAAYSVMFYCGHAEFIVRLSCLERDGSHKKNY
jgi:hypothetical protein